MDPAKPRPSPLPPALVGPKRLPPPGEAAAPTAAEAAADPAVGHGTAGGRACPRPAEAAALSPPVDPLCHSRPPARPPRLRGERMSPYSRPAALGLLRAEPLALPASRPARALSAVPRFPLRRRAKLGTSLSLVSLAGAEPASWPRDGLPRTAPGEPVAAGGGSTSASAATPPPLPPPLPPPPPPLHSRASAAPRTSGVSGSGSRR